MNFHTTSNAQVDDLADQPWATPVWDALERFRDEPLCLSCIDATDLTILPGIGRTTASRIIKLVQAGAPSLDFIADSLCLSLDQRIIIQTCAQLSCSCPPTLRYALARTRLRVADGVSPDATIRADIDTDIGRIGGLVRKTADTTIYSMWTQINAGPITAVAGNYTIQAANGMLFGGTSFARSALQAASSREITPRIRPWTSAWLDDSFFGAGVWFSDTLGTIPTDLVVSVATDQGRPGATGSDWKYGGAASVQFGHLTFGTAFLSTSDLNLASISSEFDVAQFRVRTEIVGNGIDGSGVVISMHRTFGRTRFVGLARWLHPDMHSPYGISPSSLSTIGNETGLTLGVQTDVGNSKTYSAWHIETALDVHGTLSRKYGSPLPSRGFDLIVDVEKKLLKGATLVLRIRYERELEGTKLEGTNQTLMRKRLRFTTRADVSIQATPTLRVRMRADVRAAQYDLDRQYDLEIDDDIGLLSYADVVWQPTRSLTVRHRTTVFRSTSIDVAAYTAELETDGSMRTFAGSGVGTHSLASVRWQMFEGISVSVAYSTTTRNNVRADAGAFQLDARLR